MRGFAFGAVLTVALALVVATFFGSLAGASSAADRGAGASAFGEAGPAAGGFSLTDPGVTPAAIGLSWTESTEDCFTNYTIFFSTEGDTGPWHVAASETAEATTTDVVANLQPGATYWWMVGAYYDTALLCLGGAASADSNVLEQGQPGTAYLTSPSNTSSSIALNWTNNATYGGGLTFNHYEVVEVVDHTPSNYTSLDTVTDLSATVGGLEAGESYAFYIDTYDACAGCAPHGDSITQSNVKTAGTATELSALVTPTRTVLDVGLLDGFTCTPAGGVGPYAFHWNFTNGSSVFVPGAGTSSYGYPHGSAAGYTVRCEVTDHVGDRATAASAPIVVHPDPRVSVAEKSLNVTAGQTFALDCAGSDGTAPLRANWTLGDGRTVVGAHATNDANTSYASPGTYRAVCTVRDGLGVSAVATVVVYVHAAPPFRWLNAALILLFAGIVGGILALLVAAARRKDEEGARRSALSRWVPPTGPASSVHGAKICPKCGSSNVPLRRTCQACGTPLPRNPGP